MKSLFTITAVLTTTTPMHITEPGDTRVDLDGQPSKVGFPCPSTTKMWMATRLLVSDLTEFGGAAPNGPSHLPVPCIPASSIRGQLRRRAARSIMDALISRGEQLNINAYNVLQCGAATGNPDGSGPSVAEAIEADAHPYFGLFGGGPRLIRSNLRVDTGLAITEVSLPYLKPEFEVAINAGRPLAVGWLRRTDDALMLTDIEFQARILADFHAALNDHQDRARTARVAKAQQPSEPGLAADTAAPRGLSALNAFEYVVPGTHFALRLDLEGTDEQAGLLLEALMGFVRLNRIGGFGRRGFGRFMLQAIALTENGESQPVSRRLTEVSTAWDGRAAELVDRWNEAKASISATDLERFARPGVKSTTPARDKSAATSQA